MADPPVALIFNSELDATADVSRSAMLTTKEDLPAYSPPPNAYSINIFVTTSYLNSAFYTNTYWDTNLGGLTVEDYNALIQAGNNNLSGQPKTFLFDWSSITTNTSDLDSLDSNVFNGAGEMYNFVSQNDIADATVQNVSGLLYNISFLGSVWYNHPSAVTNFASFMSPIVTISKLVETLEKVNAPELSEYRDDFFNQAYLKYKYDERDYSKLAFSAGDSLTIPVRFDISQHVRYNLCGSPVENHPNNMLTFVVDTHEYVVMKQEDTTNTQVYLLNFVATDYDPTIYQLVIQNGVLLRHTGTAPANVVIPAEVTSIASNVFKNNTTVESVSFEGTSVVSIGYEAFSGCTSLTSLPLPAGLESIGGSAFLGCSTLTSIVIPDSVTSLGNHLLDGCSLLSSVTLPTSIQDVPEHLCAGCPSLTSIVIPDTVTHIGGLAFANCTGLTSITISSSLTNIDNSAFFQCTGITSLTHIVTLAESLQNPTSSTTIFGFVLDGITGPPPAFMFTYSGSVITGYTGDLPSALSLPEGASGIGPEAFANETGLSSVTIPDSVTTLGENAFMNCTSLTSIVLPGTLACTNDENANTNGDGAFVGCTSLTSVVFPSGIAYIPGGFFGSCSSLSSITIPASVTAIGDYAFGGCAITNAIQAVGLPSAFWGDSEVLRIFGTQLIGFVSDNSGVAVVYLGTLPTAVTLPSGISGISPTLFDGNTSIESIVIPNSVTSIPATAFAGCTSLTSVTLGANTESVGDYAFYECTSLTSITIPSSVTSIRAGAFASCTSLTSVTLGANTESVDDYAFYECTSLTSITIPNSVTSLGVSALQGCTALTSIDLGSGLERIGDYAFVECSLQTLTIPNSVTYMGSGWIYYSPTLTSLTLPPTGTFTMGNYGVYGCPSLTSIVIPPGFSTEVPDGGLAANYNSESEFGNCTALTSVVVQPGVTALAIIMFDACPALTNLTLPASVTSIGEGAFNGTGLPSEYIAAPYAPYLYPVPFELTIVDHVVTGYTGTLVSSLTIPEGVTEIASGVFSGGTVLTSVSLPGTLTSIGELAFFNCTGLSSVTIPSNVLSIGNNAFAGCSALSSITIPEGVLSLGTSCFQQTALTSVVIPDSLTSIGASAFMACVALTSLSIGSGVKNIGSLAFGGCSTLTSVTLPNSVETIGAQAFQECADLTSITFGTGVTSIGDAAFADCIDMVVSGQVVNLPAAFQSESEQLRVFGDVDPAYVFVVADDVITGYIGVLPTALNVSNSVGASAFSGSTTLTSITFGDGVTTIGDGAFSGCSGITEFSQLVGFPASLTNDTDIVRIFGKTFDALLISGTTLNGYIGTLPSPLVIPSGIEVIGSNAFAACTGLTSVSFGSDLVTISYEAFVGCSALTSVTFPNSVETIGGRAFLLCSSLSSITFGTGVTSIGDRAFSLCQSMVISGQVVNLPAGFQSESEQLRIFEDIDPAYVFVFANDAITGYIGVLSSEITVYNNIAASAFANCTTLTSITFDSVVTEIGDGAFSGCTGITEFNQLVNFPASLTNDTDILRIFGKTFTGFIISGTTLLGYNGTVPDSLVIPDEIETIAASSFAASYSLTSITFGTGVTAIGDGAFAACANITLFSQLVNFPASLTNNTDIARIFGNTLYGLLVSGTTLTGYLGTLPSPFTVPSGIQTIGSNAFLDTVGLTSLTLNASLTLIDDNAFGGCTGLGSLVLNASIQSVNASAFAGCTALTSITFTSPTSISTIGSNAFYDMPLITAPSHVLNMPAGFRTTLSENYIFGKTLYSFIAILGGGTVVSGYTGNLPSALTIPNGITYITSYAFSNCSGITSLTFSASIQRIDSGAFISCTSLSNVDLPSPAASTVIIGSSAFSNTLLREPRQIPNLHPNYQTYSFHMTIFGRTLYSLETSNNAITGYTGIFPYYLIIPDGITTINTAAFSNATITSLTLPTSIETINASAFAGCTTLSSLTFTTPTNITTIGCNAFFGATALSQMAQISNMPDSFKVNASQRQIFGKTMYTLFVSNNVVTGAAGTLPSTVTIPAGVTSIGTGAFALANVSYASTTFIIGNTVQTICANAFAGTNTTKNNFIVTVSLGTSVSHIGSNAFAYMNKLGDLFVPSNVLTIDSGAFTKTGGSIGTFRVTGMQGVTSLSAPAFSNTGAVSISLGSNLSNIGASVFAGATALTSITIPASVTNIGTLAFSSIGALSTVTFATPTTIASIGNNAFAYNDGITIKNQMVNIPSSFLTSTSMTQIFGKQLT